MYNVQGNTSCYVPLLYSSSNCNSIKHCRKITCQVQQGRDSMHGRERGIESLHLIRMWCGVAVFLSVSGFCTPLVSTYP